MNEQNSAANTLQAAPFGEVFKKFLNPREYFTSINGRARRGEYWATALLVLLPSIVLGAIAGVIAVSTRSLMLFIILMLPITVMGLFMLPVTIRRWHDLGFSGWLAIAVAALVGFPCSAIPILGTIIMYLVSIASLVFFCIPGKNENNAYGADPCDPTAVDPVESIKEPWKPLVFVYIGLTALNFVWSVYTMHVAIKAVNAVLRMW